MRLTGLIQYILRNPQFYVSGTRHMLPRPRWICHQQNDVMWASKRLKSSATRQFVQANNEANIKTRITDPLRGKPTAEQSYCCPSASEWTHCHLVTHIYVNDPSEQWRSLIVNHSPRKTFVSETWYNGVCNIFAIFALERVGQSYCDGTP